MALEAKPEPPKPTVDAAQLEELEERVLALETAPQVFHIRIPAIEREVAELTEQVLDTADQVSRQYHEIQQLSDLVRALAHRVDAFQHQDLKEAVRFIHDLQNAIRTCKVQVELVFDRQPSLDIFHHLWKHSSKRLRIANPFLTDRLHWLSNTMKPSLCDHLEARRVVSIAWGFFDDLDNEPIKEWKYRGLPKLIELSRKYQNLELKCANTHEKYVIRDGREAFLGSHNFLSSYKKSDQRELGLRITDKCIIDQMIARHDAAPHDPEAMKRFLKSQGIGGGSN